MRQACYVQDPDMRNARQSNLRSDSRPGFRPGQTNRVPVSVLGQTNRVPVSVLRFPSSMRQACYVQDPDMRNARQSKLRSDSRPGFRPGQTNRVPVSVLACRILTCGTHGKASYAQIHVPVSVLGKLIASRFPSSSRCPFSTLGVGPFLGNQVAVLTSNGTSCYSVGHRHLVGF